jgi:hypothetical protein
MGITRIDFGSVEGRGNFGTLAESPKGGWEAETVDFKYKKASTGTPGIEVTYKITDEEAVDTDGKPYKGKAWDRMWVSAKAAGIMKDKLSVLGYDVDSLVIEDEGDVKDLAAELKDDFVGVRVRLVTETEEDDKDDEKLWSRVKFVNEG